MRAAGWAVGVHNDYKINGEARTFWLLTHPDGTWVKGEGRDDATALAEAKLGVLARRAGVDEGSRSAFLAGWRARDERADDGTGSVEDAEGAWRRGHARGIGV